MLPAWCIAGARIHWPLRNRRTDPDFFYLPAPPSPNTRAARLSLIFLHFRQDNRFLLFRRQRLLHTDAAPGNQLSIIYRSINPRIGTDRPANL